MTLRWISLRAAGDGEVPVEQEAARPTSAASPSVDGALAAEQLEPDLLDALVVLDAEQLAHRRLRAAGVGAAERLRG